MGNLPGSPAEVRLAATFFLALLGLADVFGAWQVRSFSSFSPAGVAATVAPEAHHQMGMAMPGSHAAGASPMQSPRASEEIEVAIDPDSLDRPRHTISRDLLVQDTHVHVPAYALTAAALSLIVFGLALSSGVRKWLVSLAFTAPALDFAGLWGAHLLPRHGGFFGALTVGGGIAMGLVYLIVLLLTLVQCWFPRNRKGDLP